MAENTSISVTHEVRKRVKHFADFKDETYSSILSRIMDDSDKLHEHVQEKKVFKGAESWTTDGSGHIPSVRMTIGDGEQ